MKPILRKSKKSLPETEIYESVNLINNILYEDRTVSEEVGVITMTIFKELIKSYHNSSFISVGDGIQVKKGNFPYDYNGVRFQTYWEWYRYSKEKYDDSVINVSAQCNITAKSLTIRISSLDGEYYKSSLYEAIQHEVFHFFERMKRGNPYKNSKYYKIAMQVFNDLQQIKKENRPYNQELYKAKEHVADIIYLASDFEQRAYVNGAYQYLKDYWDDEGAKEIKYDDAIVGTVLFSEINKLKRAYEFLKNTESDNPFLLTALKPYGLSYQEIFDICEKALYSFSRYAGRLKSKATDDFQTIQEVFDILEEFRFPLKNEEKRTVSIEEVLKKHLLI